MAEHVIILGAGASYTSGYPLAIELRSILSSSDAFGVYLQQKFSNNTWEDTARDALLAWYSKQAASIELFREGCFGTVDEFSYLGKTHYVSEIRQIKQLVGVILALHNPENLFRPSKAARDVRTTGFETSDYYTFIQRLFLESDELRNDICVMSYNYDPYLDYLLWRAFHRRRKVAGKTKINEPAGLTSGFHDINAQGVLEEKGFCLLKLHGTSILPPQSFEDGVLLGNPLTYDEVFLNRPAWLQQSGTGQQLFGPVPSPAMFFPWELIRDNNEFAPAKDFACPRLHALTKAIWERARREIVEAKKISFVGLSMHRFLEPGLTYLFAERVQKTKRGESPLEIVLACPGARYAGAEFEEKAAPNSLADRLITTLCRVYPHTGRYTSGCVISPNSGKEGVGGVVCYENFESFIRFEL